MARPRSRGNGEGSIYQRKDGRWVAAVTLGYDASGKIKRTIRYGKTRREAADRLQKVLEDIGKGIPLEPSKITVEQHFLGWLKSRKLSVATGTWKTYDSHIRNHIIPYFGWRQVRSLTKEDGTDFYLYLRDLNWPPAPYTISLPYSDQVSERHT